MIYTLIPLLTYVSVPLNKDSSDDIERILKSTFSKENLNFRLIAKRFVELRDQDNNINLRALLKAIKSNTTVFQNTYSSKLNPDKKTAIVFALKQYVAAQKQKASFQTFNLFQI